MERESERASERASEREREREREGFHKHTCFAIRTPLSELFCTIDRCSELCKCVCVCVRARARGALANIDITHLRAYMIRTRARARARAHTHIHTNTNTHKHTQDPLLHTQRCECTVHLTCMHGWKCLCAPMYSTPACVYVCARTYVCVCVRERERERETGNQCRI